MSRSILSPGKLRLLIDYDSTLFDTTTFSNDLWQTIANQANLSLQEVKNDGVHFYADPKLGGYAFDKHTSSYGLKPSVMWWQLEEMIRSNDYLYPDSPAFIQKLRAKGYVPRILSFGEERFQRAKINPYRSRLLGNENETHSSGHELGVDVTLRKKRDYINEVYPGERGTLVDDVPEQNLPEGFTEIHIDRSSAVSTPLEQEPHVFVVANLDQALEAIRSL